MINEKIKYMLRNQTLLQELLRPIEECQAHKLGVIDETGRKIKEPVSEAEKSSYSPLARTLVRIKRYLGSKLDLLTHTSLLESSSSSTYNTKNHKQLLQLESDLNIKVNEIHEIIEEALNSGVMIEQIDDILQK
jgi:hypothetical protein